MIAYNILFQALLAQGIERLPPEQKAAGSNPVEGTIYKNKTDRGYRGLICTFISA